jgi:cell division protein FtsW
VALLSLFSLLIVYSTSGSQVYKYNTSHGTEYYLIRQLMFIGAGLMLMYTAYRLHYMVYAKLAPILMVIAVPLLVYTALFGAEINDASQMDKDTDSGTVISDFRFCQDRIDHVCSKITGHQTGLYKEF